MRIQLSAREQQRRAALILRNKSLDNITKVSAALKGRPHGPLSTGHRARIADALLGHLVSPTTRQRISLAAKGRSVSPETRAKQSLVQKGRRHRPHTPETRANLSRSMRGRRLSAEHKASISSSLKRSEAYKASCAIRLGRLLAVADAHAGAAVRGAAVFQGRVVEAPVVAQTLVKPISLTARRIEREAVGATHYRVAPRLSSMIRRTNSDTEMPSSVAFLRSQATAGCESPISNLVTRTVYPQDITKSSGEGPRFLHRLKATVPSRRT